MLKSKFAQLLDMIFFILGFSLISFAWINKYIKITWLSLVIIGLLSFVLAKIIWNMSVKKYNKKNLKNAELKYAQNCIDYLSLNPDKALPLFKQILDGSVKNGNFLVKNNNLYYFDYTSEQTVTSTLSKIKNKLKQTKTTKCYLFTSALSPKTSKLLDSEIVVVSDYDAYLLMKEKNIFPIPKQKSAKIKKARLKTALFNTISKKKAKPYFFYGALLIFTSFMLPYSVLYCVVGSVSIVLGLICLCVKNNQPNNILS